MTKPKRQFDRSKYLNDPRRTLTDEQYAARMELARARARRMRPSEFWLRTAASFALALLLGGVIGWLGGWSLLHTAITIGAALVVWAAASILTWRYLKRLRQSP